MPKKYLLYIHDADRFDKLSGRGEKSGLVNTLLASYWDNQKPAKKKDVPVLPGQTKLVKMKADVSNVIAKKTGTADDVCRHGAAPGFCKYSKCPNSKRA